MSVRGLIFLQSGINALGSSKRMCSHDNGEDQHAYDYPNKGKLGNLEANDGGSILVQ